MGVFQELRGLNKQCPRCEGKRWMTDLCLRDGMAIEVGVRPVSLRQTGNGFSTVHASMCADCGYTEFYAVNPLAVWDAWSRQNR